MNLGEMCGLKSLVLGVIAMMLSVDALRTGTVPRCMIHDDTDNAFGCFLVLQCMNHHGICVSRKHNYIILYLIIYIYV